MPLRTWGPDGSLIVDADSSVALVLGSVTIGGDNQAQSGSITDARLLLGRPFHIVTTVEVNGFIGYRPIVRFNGTQVNWSWPQNTGDGSGGTLPFPKTRFIYGLK